MASGFRLALRSIRRRAWSTSAIVLTLSLGVGAMTAVYAVFNYAVFRPVPGVRRPESLVSLYVRPDHGSRLTTTMSHAHLSTLREAPAFEGVAAHRSVSLPFRSTGAADPELQDIVVVTQGYFDVLGARPVAGRLFNPDEYESLSAPVAVISERFRRSRYGEAIDVIGQHVQILNDRFTIIGVVQAFRGLDAIGTEDVWVPYGARDRLGSRVSDAHQSMVGRLAAGASLEVARQQADAAVRATGEIRDGRGQVYTAVVFAGLTDGIGVTHARMMRLYWTVTGGVAMLFLLACANAGNLLVARNLGRRRDLAVRAALGASAPRVFRELLAEAGLVSLLAAGGGLTVATVLAALFRTDRILSYLPTLEHVELDGRVAAFSVLVAVSTVMFASAVPSWLATRWRPVEGLRDGGRSSSSTGRLGTCLVVVQVALSTALLASAGVLTQTLFHLQAADVGFDVERLLTVSMRPRDIGYDDTKTTRLFRDIEDRLLETPGLQGVGFSFASHLGYGQGMNVRRPDQADDAALLAQARPVSAGYFDALGLPLRSGRRFTTGETRQVPAPPIVIVDESAARQLFGSTAVVGRLVAVQEIRGVSLREVVGVVADTGWRGLREGHRPGIYLPVGDQLRIASFHVRSDLPLEQAAARTRRVIREVEPGLPVAITTAAAELRQIAAEERLLAKLAVVVAVLALAITVAGAYAVVASRVTERRRELGIRLALGAPPRALAWRVAGRAVVTCAIGVTVGIGLYAWTSTLLAHRLYAVAAVDPPTVGLASIVLVATSLTAAWLPARRAARVDPAEVLQAET